MAHKIQHGATLYCHSFYDHIDRQTNDSFQLTLSWYLAFSAAETVSVGSLKACLMCSPL